MCIPRLIIPALVIATLFGGYALRAAFTQPTTAVAVGDASGGRQIECIVAGVKCKGTASFFTSLYKDVRGIHAIETYASDHRVVFTYDPGVITPETIRGVMEQTVLLNDGSRAQVFECLSLEEF